MGVFHPVRRFLRPSIKTIIASARWKRIKFDDVPAVFGNAKPKSGSHLLLQILNGFCQILPYRYVDSSPIRSITRDGHRRDQPEILADMKRLSPGVIGWGYLDPTAENTGFLCHPDRVNYFIYRDPRDMLVSQVFFATDMHEEHGMHAYYASLPNFDERLKAAITGVTHVGLKMVSVKQRYEAVFGWLEQKYVRAIRFENLIDHRDITLLAMLDEIERTGYKITSSREKSIDVLNQSIQPNRSRTFRAGQTGKWREYFNEDHKKLFKEVAGDLLIRLGYEKSNDW